MRILLMIGTVFLTVVTATAENAPLIDEQSGIYIPSMINDQATSNLRTRYTGDWDYFVGGGVAAFDCNDDHYPDLYFAGGQTKAQLYINQSKRGGALTFANGTAQNLNLDKVVATYPIDINSDGIMDLMVLRLGQNILFKGLGECQFERANEQWNFNGGDEWSTAFSATWEADENWPTLAIGNYVDRKAEGTPWGTCSDNQLFRPADSDDGFAEPQNLKAYCTLSLLFSDWNRSGNQSLRVSNDRQYNKNGREQLWRLAPDVATTEYTKDDGFKKLNIWGMGIASHDVNADGYPDYFLTSMGDNKLRLNTGAGEKPKYKNMAFKLGITAHKPWSEDSALLSTAWHAQFADFNNDTLIDLFIAKGNVDQMPDFAQHDPNNLLLGKRDGTFFEAAEKAGMHAINLTRGAAIVDLNLDGLLDIIEVNRNEVPGVLRNLASDQVIGNWIALDIRRLDYNKNSIGAWIELHINDKIQRKEITIGGGHASGSLGLHHFGLGEAKLADIRIIWPNGQKSNWMTAKANQFATINKQDSALTFWSPSNNAEMMH
ncbi:MAG: CRTAC1 family protein [Alphaproteobacteria bacterium]|nr:CRTAC1 family protein [Alphaproteobacteria bacterium]